MTRAAISTYPMIRSFAMCLAVPATRITSLQIAPTAIQKTARTEEAHLRQCGCHAQGFRPVPLRPGLLTSLLLSDEYGRPCPTRIC